MQSVLELKRDTVAAAAHGQRAAGTTRHDMTLQERFEQIAEVWPQLPEHIRLAVEALCLQPAFCDTAS
jgi:hypothetical protein